VNTLSAALPAPVEQLLFFLGRKDILVANRAGLTLVFINLTTRHLAIECHQSSLGSNVAILPLRRSLARVPSCLHAKAGDRASSVLNQLLQLRIDHRLLPHAGVVDAEAEYSDQNKCSVLARLGRCYRPT
jgi:hypothetical protein